MAGPVHEELPIPLRLDQMVHAALEQAEILEAARDLGDGRVVRLVPVVASFGRLGRGAIGREHDLVELALRLAEPAVDRERARDVGRVHLKLAAGVDQHELAVLELRVVRAVVEHAGVRAGRDDRRIRALGAVAPEFVQELGLELVFVHAGPDRLHRAPVCRDRDLRGAAHRARLRPALEQPHLVQQVVERDELARRVAALALRVQRLDEREQPLVELVGAERVVDAVAALEQSGQDVVEIRDRERIVGAVRRDGALRPRARPVPELALGIALAAEHQEFALRPTRHEHRDGLGLREAREVEEVAVGPVHK